MELRHIRYFLAVAREKNFTRAAQSLGMAQPPLSHQIKAMEQRMGVRLFRRTASGAELTEAGAAYLAAIADLPERAEAGVVQAQRAARGETGILRLGFTGSTILNPSVARCLRAYRRQYPDVQMPLTEANSAGLAAALQAGALDAAFLHPAALDTKGLTIVPLTREAMIAALPAQHPAAANAVVDLGALSQTPLILTPRSVGPSVHDAALKSCRAKGFEPMLGPSAPQMISVIALVASELGFSIVPQAISQLSIQGVEFRPIDGEPGVVDIALATPERLNVPQRNLARLVQ